MDTKNELFLVSPGSDYKEAISVVDQISDSEFDHVLDLALQLGAGQIAVLTWTGSRRKFIKTTPHIDSAEAILETQKNDVFKGVSVSSPRGFPIGQLLVSDFSGDALSQNQVAGLKSLAGMVTKILGLKIQLQSSPKDKQKHQFRISAMENVSCGIVLQDAAGSIIDFNPAAQEILGLAAEEMTGKTSMDPNWKPVYEDGSDFPNTELPPMVSLRTGKKHLDTVFGVHRPNNEVRWLNVNSVPLFLDGSDKPSHVVTSFIDVTEQINTKNQIKKNQDRLQFILNSLPVMIAHWDANLINLDANGGFAKYMLKTPEEVKGKHFREAVGEKLFELNKENIEKVLRGETAYFQRTIKDKDGEDIYFDGTWIPNMKDGKFEGFLSVLVDISRTKKIEFERQRLEAQLTSSSRLSALGEMASGIAHEINNPLAIIIARVAQLKKKFLLGTVDPLNDIKNLEAIDRTADRIAKIIKGLRTYSRNAENDPFESTSVRGIIEDTLELCQERLKHDDVKVSINCDKNLAMECRPAQISQVLMNLLSNAYDAVLPFPFEDRWIRMDVQSENGNILIKCIDSGNGIPQNVVDKMMQPFFTTKGVGKGTGLGLSISIGIVQCHGGKLNYAPNEKNTTFILELPKIQNATKLVG